MFWGDRVEVENEATDVNKSSGDSDLAFRKQIEEFKASIKASKDGIAITLRD